MNDYFKNILINPYNLKNFNLYFNTSNLQNFIKNLMNKFFIKIKNSVSARHTVIKIYHYHMIKFYLKLL